MKYIKQSILDKRTSLLPLLDKEMQAITAKLSLLEEIKQALRKSKDIINDAEISSLVYSLENEKSKLKALASRWKSGIVKIAVGGLEKAGKTTFLKNLTGINALPTFPERCTATLCEIENNPRKYASLVFLTEKEFLDSIVAPDIALFNEKRPHDVDAIEMPRSLLSFEKIRFPSKDNFESGTSSYAVLTRLIQLQEGINDYRDYIDGGSLQIEVDELESWVAHKQIGNRNSVGKSIAVKRCTVFSPFVNEDEPLLLLDTPGIDDPNPKARKICLELVEKEADLLMVMSRPLNKPDPISAFSAFLGSIREFDKSVSVQDFHLFILNEDKSLQNSGEYLAKHRQALSADPYCIENSRMIDVDAVDTNSIANCFEEVNKFLENNIEKRDKKSIDAIKASIKKVDVNLLDFLESLKKNMPLDSNYSTTPMYNDWFAGFWESFTEKGRSIVSSIQSDPKIREYREKMIKSFVSLAKDIHQNIPTEEDLKAQATKSNFVPAQICSYNYAIPRLNYLLNAINDSVQSFSPIVRKYMVDFLSDCGLSPIIEGANDHDAIENIVAKFESAGIAKEQLRGLREISSMSDDINLIFRWELRPIIDYVNVHSRSMKNDSVVAKFLALKTKYSKKANIQEAVKISPSDLSTQKAMKSAIEESLFVIDAVIRNQQYDFGEVASDILSNWIDSVIYGKDSERSWRNALFLFAENLIPEFKEIQANSEVYKAINLNIENLKKLTIG